MEFKFIDTDDPLYQQELALRYELLRKPLGMPPGSELFSFERESRHLVAIECGRVIGCVLFRPEGKSGRIFQMAVAEDFQRHGVGGTFLREMEMRLLALGFSEAYIHAREPVVPFYEKHGYAVDGEPFEEVGILHLKMRKAFSGVEPALQGPVSLAHKTAIDRMLGSYPPEISEHTFTNFFVWRLFHRVRIAEHDGAIVIYEDVDDFAIIVGPPIGDISMTDAVNTVEKESGRPVVAILRLPESASEAAHACGWEVTEDRDNFDYVYRREDLAELAGRNYHAKRNLIAQCLSEHACSYERITSENLAEVRDMARRWCEARGCGKEPGLCHEYRALQELFDNYERLQLMGGAIRADGAIEAFTIGERLNADTAVIHFEKGNSDVKGIYQLINQRFCREALAGFEYVNREQDLGIPGLRKAKQSYMPVRLVKKFIAWPRGAEIGLKAAAHHDVRCPE